MEDLICILKNNSSGLISGCALSLTVYQAWATRKHNRLSVQPRLTSYKHLEHDASDEKVTRVIATLSNSGLGPAFIKKFEVLVNHEPFTILEPDDLFRLITQNVSATLLESRAGVLRKEHVLSNGAKADLIDLKILNATALTLSELEVFHVRIVYESAYGDSFTYDSRSHGP